ncbi:uncharacterized protein EDB93DRAFT_1104380 [Suillus bovinus]|uniref:uncharacterized protein n=1 Tax=Suillus bovinus TaxID=48563 RepID=UPI001B86427C|nr:uncharacterized protein EDB93DRAFT_1104380 [Suillus bovinus]KAG2146384.1 hypothetical protein EDB93DRAFT_1104380 [Suillus bovinus]
MSESQNAASNTQSMSIRLGMSGDSTQTNLGGPSILEQDLVQKCISIVKDYKHTLISKEEAIITITKTIAATTDEASNQAESYITSPYFEMLEQWIETPTLLERMKINESRALNKVNLFKNGTNLTLPALDKPRNYSEETQKKYGANSSGWAEIVARKCINLDAVHSIISSSHTIDKCTETIGDIEIKFSGTSASDGRHFDEDKQSKPGAPAQDKSAFSQLHKPAAMHMSAHMSKTANFAHDITWKRGILRNPSPSPHESPLKCPHHRRGLIWSPVDATFSPTAHSSEYAEPVPSPPSHEASDSDVA